MYQIDDVETPAFLYTEHLNKIYASMDEQGEVTLKDLVRLQDLGFQYINELNEANLQLNIENGQLLKQLNKRSR